MEPKRGRCEHRSQLTAAQPTQVEGYTPVTCQSYSWCVLSSMSKKTVLLAVMLMLTMSLSGCLRNGNGGGDTGPVYEPGPYEVITYEDVVYASGLAHTQTSTEASAVPLKLDVYCPDRESTDRPVLMFIHGGDSRAASSTSPRS